MHYSVLLLLLITSAVIELPSLENKLVVSRRSFCEKITFPGLRDVNWLPNSICQKTLSRYVVTSNKASFWLEGLGWASLLQGRFGPVKLVRHLLRKPWSF